MATERVIKVYEPEYSNFKAVAALLEATSPNGARYIVEDVYLDYGQNWMWTTICREGYMDCQVLNPREWELVYMADSLDDLYKAAKEIKNGKFFND